MAPEVITNLGYGYSADWYALGIIIYELINGHTPFYKETNPIEIFRKVLSAEDFTYRPQINRYTKKLITSLTRHNVDKRMGCCKKGIKRVKDHDFFKSMNWDDLIDMKKENVPNGLIESFAISE